MFDFNFDVSPLQAQRSNAVNAENFLKESNWFLLSFAMVHLYIHTWWLYICLSPLFDYSKIFLSAIDLFQLWHLMLLFILSHFWLLDLFIELSFQSLFINFILSLCDQLTSFWFITDFTCHCVTLLIFVMFVQTLYGIRHNSQWMTDNNY